MAVCRDYSLMETLRHNLGKVCTVYSESGNREEGFTGVLAEVDGSACKLIALGEPLRGGDYCDGARRIHTIPIDKIACLATSQY